MSSYVHSHVKGVSFILLADWPSHICLFVGLRVLVCLCVSRDVGETPGRGGWTETPKADRTPAAGGWAATPHADRTPGGGGGGKRGRWDQTPSTERGGGKPSNSY